MNTVDAIYRLCLSLLVVFFAVIIYAISDGALEHPARNIEGVWEEVEWVYERVDRAGSSLVEKDALRTRLKNEISEDLIIHKSETWKFNRDNTLTLMKKDKNPVTLEWRLKGRGHILKLKHESGALEFYQIRELDRDEMILHFENDIHARGIVKIVFKKVK